MKKKDKVDADISEYPYISFDESLELADKIKAAGGRVDKKQMQEILKKKGGWLAIQVSSLRRWGLIEGRGESKLTELYKRIRTPEVEGDDSFAKQEAFLNIPLFKTIYEDYKEHGLPQEPYFTNKLKNKYGLSGRNPSLVASIIRDFISKYFPKYGSTTSELVVKVDEAKSPKTIDKVSNLKDEKLLEGSFPITILTKDTPPFKWDIKSEADFAVIDAILTSIKERWKELHKHKDK